MKLITIYRSDFKINADGQSYFDTVVLSSFGVENHPEIEEVEMLADETTLKFYDDNGDEVRPKDNDSETI